MKAAVLRWALAAAVVAGVYGLFAWDNSAARAGETGPVAKAQAAGWDALVGAGQVCTEPLVHTTNYAQHAGTLLECAGQSGMNSEDPQSPGLMDGLAPRWGRRVIV